MAHYTTTIDSPRAPDETFDYLADLRNFAEWDPGVRSVTQVTGDGGGPDAVFDVEVATGKGTTTFRYHTTDHEPPSSVRIEARTRWFTSIDRIDVAATDRGCAVTYDADLRLNGPLRLFDLALRPVFGRIGDRARQGLVEVLDGTARP